MSYGVEPDVPRVVYSLWLQGFDRAPELVRVNMLRWARLNPGWRVEVLDRVDVETLLGGTGVNLAALPPQAVSDLVRARLLLDGGLWVDATVYPVRPLEEWLPALCAPAGMFAFAAPGADRLLSSWLLAATPRHPLFLRWWQECLRYWTTPRPVSAEIPADPVEAVTPGRETQAAPYFWFHYLFAYLVAAEPELAELWERCPIRSAQPAHVLQELVRRSRRPSVDRVAAALQLAPVHKLQRQVDYPWQSLARLRP